MVGKAMRGKVTKFAGMADSQGLTVGLPALDCMVVQVVKARAAVVKSLPHVDDFRAEGLGVLAVGKTIGVLYAAATNVLEPWSDVSGAVSLYLNPTTITAQFFRVKE